MKQSGANILINCLLEQGVDTIFGYPGGAVLDIYDALYTSGKIKHVLTAHEQGAAHAADGYARVTGKTGVCFATSGPGATNLVTGIATAYMDSIPLVAVTGNVGLNFLGRDSFQEIDICGITIPITKHNFIVKDVKDLADIIRRAFEIAESGRKGPVLIDILKNVQVAECDYEPKPKKMTSRSPVETKNVKEIAEVINSAERPLIMAGGGVIASDASDALRKFAEKLDCPVAYTLMSKGCIPDNDKRCLGMLGMHGTITAVKAMQSADVVIALGTRFSDRVALNRDKFGENKTLIQIDIDSAEIDKNVKTNLHLQADINEFLKAVTPLICPGKHTAWLEETESYRAENSVKKDTSIRAYKILSAASALAPEGTPLITDVGQHQMWTAQHFDLSVSRTFCTSGGLGTMGYGLGAAIGAALGSKKTCVLVTGDGCLGMNMNELMTAAQNNVPLVILLMDNSVLGMVRQWQKIFYGRRFSQTTLKRKVDYVALAESLGAEGLLLNEDGNIDETLKKAFEIANSGKTVLVDCKISSDENVLPMIKPGLTYDTQLDKMEEN